MRPRFLFLIFLAVGSATTGAAEAPPRSLDLLYNQDLVKAGFPSPVALVVVHGVSAWFLIDTGAGVHTLADWFVKEAKITTADLPQVTARDSMGHKVTLRAVQNLTAQVGRGPVVLEWAAVAEFPPFFRQHLIGGLLSPQLLAPADTAASFDLRIPRLTFEPFSQALARFGAKPMPAKICSSSMDHPNRLYGFPAEVSGHPVVLGLDSGAAQTSLLPSSMAAQALASRQVPGRRTVGVGGVEQREKLVRGATVALGGLTATTDLSIGGGGGDCSPDGNVGMDVLRNCVLVLAKEQVAVSCSADSAHQ
jgi:Aspartyl protease